MFYSEDHQNAFEAARKLTQTGTSLHGLCGAKTRNGGYCRQLPLAGHNRCLRHAGPKAANEFRERQRRDMERGKISFREFDLAERRRAANRLHDQWKKNPWLPGKTIDLAEHEPAFLDDVRHWAGAIEQLPPGVADWLRWRYRRLQLNRVNHDRWIETLRSELPRRVGDAGPRPGQPRRGEASVMQSRIWGTDQPTRKRSRPDQSRRTDPANLSLPKSTNRPMPAPVRIAEIVKSSAATLSPLIKLCASEDERSNLVAALVEYVSEPNSQTARRRWLDWMAVLRAR